MRGLARKVMRMVLPWPSREHRQAAVDAARREKEQSRAQAASAALIGAAIERMAAENHFAAILAEQLMRQHREAS